MLVELAGKEVLRTKREAPEFADVARQTGQTDILADVAPSAHIEVGGDKAIKQAGAGDINLF